MDSIFKSTHRDKYPFIYPSNAYLKDSARGKTVLVTGASRGIGKVNIMRAAFPLNAITDTSTESCRVLRYDCAATLILTARREGPLECKTSITELAPACKVVIFAVDVSLQKSVEGLFLGLHGPGGVGLPDVLVNNAGSAGSIKSGKTGNAMSEESISAPDRT